MSGFVIFSTPRSGSSLLCKAFESQGYTVAFEPFNGAFNYTYNLQGNEEVEIAKILSRYSGLKHIVGQGHYNVSSKKVLQTLLSCNKNSVRIKRKNMLACALSYCIAYKTHAWQGRPKASALERIGSINTDSIIAVIDRIKSIDEYPCVKTSRLRLHPIVQAMYTTTCSTFQKSKL